MVAEGRGIAAAAGAMLCLAAASLPAAGCRTPVAGERAAVETAVGTYEVRAGDTLSEIAERFDVVGGSAALAQLNDLRDPHDISAGGRLLVRAGPSRRQTPRPLESRAPLEAPLEPCAVRPLPPPTASTVEGCQSAHCAFAPGGLSACFCLSELPAALPSRVEVRSADGELLSRWGAESHHGETSGLVALFVDLGGPPGDELVVATRKATSNGMEVSTWTVAVVHPGVPEPSPMRFVAEDFGADTFVHDEQTRRCSILATEWLDDDDPVRGRGHYFVGRRYLWEPPGELLPLESSPILARRYLFAFERQRLSDLARSASWQGSPRGWLDSAGTEVRDADPLLQAARRGVREVTVEEVTEGLRADGRPGHLVFSFPGGGLRNRRPYIASPGGAAGGNFAIRRLGHRPTNRLLPPGYRPARATSSLAARGGTLEHRRSERGLPAPVVLWLD